MSTPRSSTPSVRAVVTLLLALLLAVPCAQGFTLGVSGQLDGLGTALDALHVSLQPAADGGDKAAKKQITAIVKLGKLLAKTSTAKSYANEMKAAAKAAKVVAKKLGDESTLVAALDAAAAYYRADLGAARDELAAQLASLSGKALAKAQKTLAKADAKLGIADAALSLPDQLGALAAAAKLLAPVPGSGSPAVSHGPYAMALDATGSWLYLAEEGDPFGSGDDGQLRQMAIAANGTLSDLSPAAVVGVTHPRTVATHPSAAFAYVGGTGSDGVAQYAIGGNGQLTPLTPATVAMPGDSPVAALAIDSTGTWLYALGSVFNGSPIASFLIGVDGTLTLKGWDYAAPFGVALAVAAGGLHVWTTTIYNGSLLHPEIRSFENDGVGGMAWTGGSAGTYNAYYDLVLSPGGSRLYAAHDGATTGVSVFDVGLDGELTPFGVEPAAGAYPDAIVITADGKWVYVANRLDDTIGQYAVGGDGSLTALSPATVAAPQPSDLILSPDGLFLLASDHEGKGAANQLVTRFAIGANGKLTAN